MIPEYGQLALNFAFLLSMCLAVVPLLGTVYGRVVWMATARSLATGLFVFVVIAYACLTWSFYVDDFSVKYVANHSNSLLPTIYKVCAVWGGARGLSASLGLNVGELDILCRHLFQENAARGGCESSVGDGHGRRRFLRVYDYHVKPLRSRAAQCAE